MHRVALRLLTLGALAAGLAGCGKGGGFLGQGDGTPRTAAAPSAPVLPGGPSAAELAAGKMACDTGTPRSVAFGPLPGALSYGGDVPLDSSPAGVPNSVVPAKSLLRGGVEIGTVLAAGSRVDATRAAYVNAVAKQAQGQGLAVKPTTVAGKPAIAFRSPDGAEIGLSGVCRAWIVTADTGQTARRVAAALVQGE